MDAELLLTEFIIALYDRCFVSLQHCLVSPLDIESMEIIYNWPNT